MKRGLNEPLGFSAIDVKQQAGTLATIYADRVEALAAEAGVQSGALLGRVFAHEIGHLLLGTTRHARYGLMRALWLTTELRRDEPLDWMFSGRDGADMRRHLMARAASVTRPDAVVAWTDPVGPEVIAVSGGVVSTGVAVAVGLAVAVADGPGVTVGSGVGVGGPIGGPGPAGAVSRSARARQLLPSRRSRTRRAPSAHANRRYVPAASPAGSRSVTRPRELLRRPRALTRREPDSRGSRASRRASRDRR